MTPRKGAVVAVLAAVAFGVAFLATNSGSSDSKSGSAVKELKLSAPSIGAAITKAATALPQIGSVPKAASPAPSTSTPTPSTSGGSGSGGSGGSGGTIIQG